MAGPGGRRQASSPPNSFQTPLNHKGSADLWATAASADLLNTLFYPIFDPQASANYRYGHLESNALIGIEFGEFRQKLKSLEFR